MTNENGSTNENIIYKPADNFRQFDYRFDPEAAKIYLAFLDEGMLETIILRVDYIRNYWQKQNKKLTEITLFLSSYGGDIYEIFGIVDYIQNLKNEHNILVNVECYSKAMSVAMLILASATGKRRISKNSYVIFDEGRAATRAKNGKGNNVGFKSLPGDGAHQVEYTDKMNEHSEEVELKLTKILAESTNLSEEFWKEIQDETVFLNAEKCLEYNIVDEILK